MYCLLLTQQSNRYTDMLPWQHQCLCFGVKEQIRGRDCGGSGTRQWLEMCYVSLHSQRCKKHLICYNNILVVPSLGSIKVLAWTSSSCLRNSSDKIAWFVLLLYQSNFSTTGWHEGNLTKGTIWWEISSTILTDWLSLEEGKGKDTRRNLVQSSIITGTVEQMGSFRKDVIEYKINRYKVT